MKGTIGICSNVFAGAHWAETQASLAHSLPQLRAELEARLGEVPELSLDLWLSANSAFELQKEPRKLAEFRELLELNQTRVEMMNAFPYGEFHGVRVKEGVYRPDWTKQERVEYTKCCFELLNEVAQQGRGLAVSSLPASHKQFLPHWWSNSASSSSATGECLLKNLREFALWLEARSERWGRDLHLGLEPEPFGLFENLEETQAFFQRLLEGCSAFEKEVILRRIGVNYDVCHFALQFEGAFECLDALKKEGIRLSKLHLSNALEVNPHSKEAIALLQEFDEPVYLHQVIAQFADGSLARKGDLPEALADTALKNAQSWRVHFHLPLHAQPMQALGNTQGDLVEALRWWQQNPTSCEHVAIETYTWAVMPKSAQVGGVEQMLAAEYEFVLEKVRQG